MFQSETNTQLKHEEEFDGILRRICMQDNAITEQNKVLNEEEKKLEKLIQEKECKLIGLLKNTKKKQTQIEARVSVLIGKMNLLRKQGCPLTKKESSLYEKTLKINSEEGKIDLKNITEEVKYLKGEKKPVSIFSELENYLPTDNNDQTEVIRNLFKQTKGLGEILESIKEIKACIEIMKDL